MRHRTFPSTGWQVSEVGFGAWAIGGNEHGNSYGTTDDAASKGALRRGLELGCTFIDTADVYGHGHSETLIGDVLSETGAGEGVKVATKVGGDFYGGRTQLNFDPAYIRFALGKSLARLQRDRVDLYQLHNPPDELVHDETLWDCLEGLADEGLIGAYGISIHDPREGLHAMEHAPRIASIQVVYNAFARGPEEELFAAAAAKGVAIIAREPLSNGFLTGKYAGDGSFEQGDIRSHWPLAHVEQRAALAERLRFLERDGRSLTQAALRFALQRPEVTVAIPGAKTPGQVEENLAASEAPPLTEDELARLDEALYAKGRP